MVFILHDEQHKLINLSESYPKESKRYLEIDKDAAEKINELVTQLEDISQIHRSIYLKYNGKHLPEYTTKGINACEENYICLNKKMTKLILNATENLEEAKKDLEILVKYEVNK